jgi:hypothetical protein
MSGSVEVLFFKVLNKSANVPKAQQQANPALNNRLPVNNQ